VTEQYLRHVTLVASGGGQGIDLSQMHIQFRVFAPDAEGTPPRAYVRIWNLTTETAERVRNEFDKITLQAGYDEPGVIFEGTIVQTKRGAETAIDRYLDIVASDLDLFRNFTLVSATLAKGSSQRDQLNTIMSKAADSGATIGSIPNDIGTGGTLPRGKVMFGMAGELMSGVSKNTETSWFSQDGKINLVKRTGYLPGEEVVLTSETGMIGVPETTNDGVEVRCLINPRIRVGCRVKIDNASITNTRVNRTVADPLVASNFPANLSADGTYRVLVVEHAGDNRGPQFESTLTCLAVDSSAAPASSVAGGAS
jgi:hypothetical protein